MTGKARIIHSDPDILDRHKSLWAILENLFGLVKDFARGRTIQGEITAVSAKFVGWRVEV